MKNLLAMDANEHECNTRNHNYNLSIGKYFSLQILLLLYFIFSTSTLASATTKFDYKDALHKSLLYFEAQRSGHLPYNQRVTWRDHSGLTDGLQQGVDLVGGYYDAGDHVKFGLPMAFTVTMLSWSAIEFGDEIRAAGEFGHVLEAIKWGTDYFIKAHTKPNEFWAQVGDGDSDHYCWQRPEDMTTPRQAYKIDSDHPGSDVAGETAAAMAAASMLFNASNKQYSIMLVQHAEELFHFGDKYRGKYDGSIAVAKSYYPSWSGYYDELLWAALWLFKATGKNKYLEYLVENGKNFGGTGWAVTEFSWDVKYAGIQIMAAKLLLDQAASLTDKQKQTLTQFRSKAEHYVCACLNKNNGTNLKRSPGGMLFVRQWNNLQYVSSATFLLTIYSHYLSLPDNPHELRCPDDDQMIDPAELFALAESQVHYILGSNPRKMSYLVGYGRKYPMNVHHRGSSIVSYKKNKGFIGCMQGYYNWYGRRGANPNMVVGALVGGPDSRDNFRDHRGTYMQTEACTYNTAPLVGIFARLHHLAEEKHIQEMPHQTYFVSSS